MRSAPPPLSHPSHGSVVGSSFYFQGVSHVHIYEVLDKSVLYTLPIICCTNTPLQPGNPYQVSPVANDGVWKHHTVMFLPYQYGIKPSKNIYILHLPQPPPSTISHQLHTPVYCQWCTLRDCIPIPCPIPFWPYCTTTTTRTGQPPLLCQLLLENFVMLVQEEPVDWRKFHGCLSFCTGHICFPKWTLWAHLTGS